MKNNKYLILLSVLLFVTHGVFVVFTYFSDRNDLRDAICLWSEGTRDTFNLALEEKSIAMQQIATYVGHDPLIQHLFLQASRILEKNDMDYDAPEVKQIRKALFESVRNSWDVMHDNYDVRQLHFHFGPGSTSFLRVHKPGKYGDNMDHVRYTIVDANALLTPTRGFETGRIYSGIRGVIPVFITDTNVGEKLHIGALEAGTSFSFLLDVLSQSLSTDFAVLLTKKHIEKNMWDEFVAKKFGPLSSVGSFFIEDSTRSLKMTKILLEKALSQKITVGSNDCNLVELNGQRYQVAMFSLRDYRGNLNHELPDVGKVLAWRDITAKWTAYRSRFYNTILIAVASLVVLQIFLIVGWYFGSRQLRKIIEDQTAELEALATRDQLTGILNRWKLEEYFTREISRHHRYDTVFSVIMFDLDHFKNVNDTWGHDVGDMVLKEVVAQTGKNIRETDVFARWGGEEFLLLLPETKLDVAGKVAERIRATMEETVINEDLTVTLSLGVVQHQQGETMDETLKRADNNLYEAKEGGRNRVVTR
ncbi:sensor domain-containing diguanylate cyclase [Desulfoplanes sp.]